MKWSLYIKKDIKDLMQEQKDVKKLVAGYIEEMNNYDPDLQ